MSYSVLPEHLTRGYSAFKGERYARESQTYHKLAKEGQSPETLVIACCDSRAAPEVIFDAMPGEIFVVRNVANLVPPYDLSRSNCATSAALEFAVQSLKVKHILVLGHSQCGGIKAALSPDFKALSPGDSIGNWVKLLSPATEKVQGEKDLEVQERQTMLERVAISHSLMNLRTFPYVHALEAQGRLSLYGAWFDIATGTLWAMNTAGDFVQMR